MANLIQKADFLTYRHISNNVNEVRKLDPYVLEAERIDLVSVIGAPLYQDLVANIAEPKYVTLMDGEVYTFCENSIQFHGLKPVLVYYAYARYLNDINSNSTAFGMQQKTSDFGEQVSSKSIERKMNEARSIAVQYAQELAQYLREKKETYPLYCEREGKDIEGSRPSITAVG